MGTTGRRVIEPIYPEIPEGGKTVAMTIRMPVAMRDAINALAAECTAKPKRANRFVFGILMAELMEADRWPYVPGPDGKPILKDATPNGNVAAT